MSQDIFILLVKGVGRYLIIIFNSGAAEANIEIFLVDRFERVEANSSSISFSLEAHENPTDVIQKIFCLYEQSQPPDH